MRGLTLVIAQDSGPVWLQIHEDQANFATIPALAASVFLPPSEGGEMMTDLVSVEPAENRENI